MMAQRWGNALLARIMYIIYIGRACVRKIPRAVFVVYRIGGVIMIMI